MHQRSPARPRSGDHYCGTVGDNCGGSLDCGNDCPPGWTCGADHICKGDPDICAHLSCTTSSKDHYCGTVGDNCGGTLECGDDCPAGWTCGADHICKGGAGVCTPATCETPSGDRYCGIIGDACGGTLDCGATCPEDGWVCDDHMCKGNLACKSLTCVAPSGDNYCGAIGDGCGGTLDCGPTCPKDGWVCDSGLCKAGPLPIACREPAPRLPGTSTAVTSGTGVAQRFTARPPARKTDGFAKATCARPDLPQTVCRGFAQPQTATSTAVTSVMGADRR